MTSFDTIIDLAMATIQDYKLNNLYDSSQDDFATITNAFLVRGLPEFTNCKSSLAYDSNQHAFLADLSPLEISILADLWVYEWFNWHVQNVTQFQGKMSPSDFKHYSEAENLKQKSEYMDKIREKIKKKMVDYSLQTVDWDSFGN